MKRDLKMLVIGLDGASPILINKWINNLPIFQKFMKKGIIGQTVPPVPAQTPVAWTTFMTGKNPGNHGIFSFAIRKEGTYERKIIGPEMIKSKTLWHILTEAGKKIVTINIPMTDIKQVKGVIIPGFPSSNEGIPYPRRVKEKIKKKFKIDKIEGDLETETLERVETDPDLFFERINKITEKMAEITLYLVQEEKWDFFMPVFMALDRIQHFFWKYIDPTFQNHRDKNYYNFVKDLYIKLDKIIGEFLKFVYEDTIVMIISDHGFCPIHTEVIVNDYLRKQGFINLEYKKIDMEQSKAISYGCGDIWLNVKKRDPKNLVKQVKEYETTRNRIIECLNKIKINGRKPIKNIKKREDVWWGKYLNKAPDLITFFNIGYQAARRPLITTENNKKLYFNTNPRWSGGHDGTHDPNDVTGIIGIIGPGIPAGKNIKLHLWDVAPTILSIMNVHIPDDFDGKPFNF